MDIVKSYTAAGLFPVKVLLNKENIIRDGKIVPYHVQINPTNKCNLNCSFCSCSAREKKLRIKTELLLFAMSQYANMGCKSVTITGGGEPLLHPDINHIIKQISYLKIKIGLVTNGTQFDKLSNQAMKHIDWIRISSDDSRDFTHDYEVSLNDAIVRGSNIDWAFSHVLSKSPNTKTISRIVAFANFHDFTHVRIVSDLLDLKNIPDMNTIASELDDLHIRDDIVIYQGRKRYTEGRKKCLISLLKPVIGADGGLYPCCGTQYASKDPSLDYHDKMRMGTMGGIKEIFKSQRYFDGSNCMRCYYDAYNELLSILLMDVNHKEFV